MELKQRTELRHVLAPELRQSLKVLTISLMDLRNIVEEELVNNPCLEEDSSQGPSPSEPSDVQTEAEEAPSRNEKNSQMDIASQAVSPNESLQEVLNRQLSVCVNTDEELRVGLEIISRIDDNGYLKTSLEELAVALNVGLTEIERLFKIIQQFEPAGVCARTVPECLLLQLERNNELDPLLKQIVGQHLENIAKKNYSLIARELKEPLDKIEPLIKKVIKLEPKPGRNFSNEIVHRIIPDATIEEKGEKLEINIDQEYLPAVIINQTYKKMLKKENLDAATREFITNKLNNANELLKAIAKRKSTLKKVVEKIAELQQEAIRQDLSHLKPMTFADLARELNLNESTVCRTVMNKYINTPRGMIALKDFFTGKISDENTSSAYVKKLIAELIEEEDKKCPLSDEDIVRMILERNNIKIARRTVAKYREELKILSSSYRKER